MKIVRFLKDSGLLIKDVTKTKERKQENKNFDFI